MMKKGDRLMMTFSKNHNKPFIMIDPGPKTDLHGKDLMLCLEL